MPANSAAASKCLSEDAPRAEVLRTIPGAEHRAYHRLRGELAFGSLTAEEKIVQRTRRALAAPNE